MILLLGRVVLVLGGLIIVFAGLYDWRRLNEENPLPIPNSHPAVDFREPEVMGDPSVAQRFAPILLKAQRRFPQLQVWGQYILGGTGYGIFFTDGTKKSCWQAMSKIEIDGKPQQIDVFLSDDVDKETDAAFVAVGKSFGIEVENGVSA